MRFNFDCDGYSYSLDSGASGETPERGSLWSLRRTYPALAEVSDSWSEEMAVVVCQVKAVTPIGGITCGEPMITEGDQVAVLESDPADSPVVLDNWESELLKLDGSSVILEVGSGELVLGPALDAGTVQNMYLRFTELADSGFSLKPDSILQIRAIEFEANQDGDQGKLKESDKLFYVVGSDEQIFLKVVM